MGQICQGGPGGPFFYLLPVGKQVSMKVHNLNCHCWNLRKDTTNHTDDKIWLICRLAGRLLKYEPYIQIQWQKNL